MQPYNAYSPPTYPAAPPPTPAALARPSFPKAVYLVPVGIAAGLDYLGRIASSQGAVHSIGDAVLPGGFALGAAVVGGVLAFARHSAPLITGVCLLVAGAATDFAVAGFSARWGLPAGVAAIAAVAGGGAMTQFAQYREARAERREERAHERGMQHDQLNAAHHRELVRADGAEVRAHYAERHAELADRAASAAFAIAVNNTRSMSQRSDYAINSLEHLTPEARAFVYAQLKKSLGPSIPEFPEFPDASPAALPKVEAAWTD